MRSLLIRLGLLASLALAACTPAPTPSGGAVPAGTGVLAEVRADSQVLNIAMKGIFGNPTPQASASQYHIYYPLYDNLTHISGDYTVKPWIATKWEVATDLLTWRFTIRKDVKWPDGSALTVDDVIFSITTLRELRWPQSAYFLNLKSLRAVDDATIELVTTVPDMTIPSAANFVWVLPKKYFESVGFEEFTRKPVGSGPYELVDFKVGTSVQFKKRAGAHAFRKAEADALNITVIPENSQIINGLQTGAIDLAADITFSGEQAERVKSLGFAVTAKSSGVLYIMTPMGSYESRNTPLKDKRVRQAVQYAIDREGIAKTLFKGFVKPIGQIGIENTLYYDANIRPFPYDPARAKQLLAEAGYPNGFALPVGLDYTPDMTLPDFALAIQGNLRAVGIDVPLISNERALFVDKAYGRNNLPKGDMWSASQGDQIGFGGSRVFIGCGKPEGGPGTALNWCNPEWDRLMDAAAAEPNEARRAQILKQANKLQVDDSVYMGVVTSGTFTALDGKIRGLQPDNPIYYHFDSVYKVK